MSEDKETKVVTWDELNHEHQKCLRWTDHGPLRTKSKYDQMEMVQADDMRRGVGSGLLGRAQRMIEARDLTIDSLEQKLIALEQQLKTAKQDAVRIFANHQADLIANIDGASTRDSAIHKGISLALLAQSQCYIRMLDDEYANNLEGK